MSTTTKPNKATASALVQALIAGTQKHAPNGSFTLGSATYTAASLIQQFENLENAMTATNAAHVQAKDAVQAQKAVQATVGPLLVAYKRYLQVTLGTGTQLADYGLQPLRARKPLTSQEQTVAHAKATATRAARGTKGKKQKLAVKGDVTSVNITPVKVAPVTTATAAPAVTSSSANASSVASK